MDMLDKDRLIIINSVGLKNVPWEMRSQLVNRSEDLLVQKFDGSVRVITVPDMREEYSFTIKALNTEVMTPEELETLINKANETLKEFKELCKDSLKNKS